MPSLPDNLYQHPLIAHMHSNLALTMMSRISLQNAAFAVYKSLMPSPPNCDRSGAIQRTYHARMQYVKLLEGER